MFAPMGWCFFSWQVAQVATSRGLGKALNAQGQATNKKWWRSSVQRGPWGLFPCVDGGGTKMTRNINVSKLAREIGVKLTCWIMLSCRSYYDWLWYSLRLTQYLKSGNTSHHLGPLTRTGVWPVVTSWYGWELQLFLHFEKHGEKWVNPVKTRMWPALERAQDIWIHRELGFLDVFGDICDLWSYISSHWILTLPQVDTDIKAGTRQWTWVFLSLFAHLMWTQ